MALAVTRRPGGGNNKFDVTLMNLSGWQLAFLRVAVMRAQRVREATLRRQVSKGKLRASVAAITLVEIDEIVKGLMGGDEEEKAVESPDGDVT